MTRIVLWIVGALLLCLMVAGLLIDYSWQGFVDAALELED
jgi:hypothetical protein